MNTQHEDEHYPEDHHGNGEEGFDHQDHGDEDQQHEGDSHGGSPSDSHEVLKIKLEVHLDRYQSSHDDEEGKSPLVLFLHRQVPFGITWGTPESRKQMIGLIFSVI